MLPLDHSLATSMYYIRVDRLQTPLKWVAVQMYVKVSNFSLLSVKGHWTTFNRVA